MLNVKLITTTTGLFLGLSYLLCLGWGLLTPEALHMHGFLESVLPGFRWLSLPNALLGLAESFGFGVYFGFTFAVIHNALAGRFEKS